MNYQLEKIKNSLRLPQGLAIISPPPEIKADLAIPCFQRSPQTVAKKIRSSYIEKIEISGRYINLTLNKAKLAEKVLREIAKLKSRYGSRAPKKSVIFLEYSSPNIAKPMHIGHLRNTLIGNSLKKIYAALGYKVISANYLGDWGAQFGQLLAAWQKSQKKKIDIEYLAKLYAKKANKEEAAKMFSLLEKGDRQLTALWKKIREASIKEFKRIYKKLGVSFNLWRGESCYKNAARQAIKEALNKKIAEYSEGAVIVNLEKEGLRTYLLQRSDGSTLYSARDLAAAQWRLKKYQPAKILYVVGQEQSLYLKQIFKTLEKMGYAAAKLEHVSYNLVVIGGKKASTRAGRVVWAKDVLQKAEQKAGKQIGIGAVIFNLLSQKRAKVAEFSWDKALNLKGDSGPYLQYSYVRAQSILKKAGSSPSLTFKPPAALSLSEENLIMSLAKYPEIVQEAGKLKEPHLIAVYLNHLAKLFNRFYETEPVLNAPETEKRFRLALTYGAAQVIKNGLGLLGIKTVEKM